MFGTVHDDIYITALTNTLKAKEDSFTIPRNGQSVSAIALGETYTDCLLRPSFRRACKVFQTVMSDSGA
jgi:hypothetical protein